ncbi:FAD binding domain protein [Phaeosphaeriaceae sp. PMI808]|nr:FAD binding domain protein [Phaeosphaeriaceae sp. PMI808]
MTDTRPFRVIIGGGGIAGLTLANSLEKAGIDYTLLEARDTISPRFGASIGFTPNGCRILDQLGCFTHLEEKTVPLNNHFNRYSNGNLIYASDGFPLTGKRFNYPVTFLEREIVLHTLYNNLQDKSKVKLLKRISKVDHNSDEVTVLCEDGTSVSGDVLVGCDGVHSKVLCELWRLSQLPDTPAPYPEDQLMFAEYSCLFGISAETEGLLDGDIHVNYAEGSSLMTIGGKGRAFWFAFQKMDNLYKAPNIPRYTTEDAEIFASQIQNASITPHFKFSDLWRTRRNFTLVAIEEAQLKRWSWGRIACVGDCVHKMTPNLGAGGNAAIETAAALANEIKKVVDASEKGKPSFNIIQTHLGNYQTIRETRLTAILTAANALTRLHALKTWKDKLFAFWVLPLAGDTFTNLNCDTIVGAVKLEYLPVPERSLHGTMPFNPSQGLGQTESKFVRALKALPFLCITAAASYFMLGVTATFSSFQFVDEVCNWQSYSFLMDLGILYSIFLIESARRANILTLISVPLLLGYNMQFFGIGVLIALYCFIHYVQSPIGNFGAKDMRLTDMGYTASVLPVLAVAHYIPHFGSYLPSLNPQTRHMWNWIWQPFPVYVSILQFLLKKTVMPDTVQKDRFENVNRDMLTIHITVGSFCVLSSATWWYTFYEAPYSLATLFIPNLSDRKSGDDYIRMYMQFDEIFSMGALLLWLLYLYSDLRKAGMIKDTWTSIVLKGVISLFTLGPGVTVGVGWLYRERLLATKWHKDALVPVKVQ